MNKWAHLGHALGECWSDGKLTFIHIPKNASSSIKGCLINLGFKHYDTLQNTANYFVVLRDPVDRWVSGMAEFQLNSGNVGMKPHEIFETITFDDHTEEQVYFIQEIKDNITFLKCDSTLTTNLLKFLQEQGYNPISVVNINISKDSKLFLKETLKKILDENPSYLEKIQNHFEKDYNLYNSVKFYD